MIRYYETTGLIPKAVRTYSGYRHYNEHGIHILRFIIGRVQQALVPYKLRNCCLFENRQRPARELATEHLIELRAKIAELKRLPVHCRN